MLFYFIIPKFINKYNSVVPIPENAPQWGQKESCLTIFEFWTRFTLDDIKLYQVDLYKYADDYEYIVSCEWVMELMTNSFTPDLNKCIDETFNSLEEMDQGGITFVKIALDEIFVMINYGISGLHK